MQLDDGLLQTFQIMQDERAITRTLHRYGHAIDYGDEAAWVDLFLEDGVFHVAQVTSRLRPARPMR